MQSLKSFLSQWAGKNANFLGISDVLCRIEAASDMLAREISEPNGEGAQAQVIGENTDGDAQKALDIRADEMFMDALKGSAVKFYGTEEQEKAVVLNSEGSLGLSIDPLDGSSNIETNGVVGTIFSILPVGDLDAEATFNQSGDAQIAAGYVAYGPRTQLFLTLGQGTMLFQMGQNGQFVLVDEKLSIALETKEYAINSANFRHWGEGVRTYFEDCNAGEDGPRGKNFGMRWMGSLVGDCSRIFARGGVFLYPGDKRKGYENGRLRLVYEAFPIAFLIEQAGGKASTGTIRILDLIPRNLHERIPLVFGSAQEVSKIEAVIADPTSSEARS